MVSGPSLRPLIGQQQLDQQEGQARHERRGQEGAHVQGRLRVAALPGAHEEGADDRQHDAGAGDDQRQEDGVVGLRGVLRTDGRDPDRAQNHGAHDGADERFEQVRAHACYVAHVVAHQVGDRGRVARVVLGDARLDLAHQVCAHVGRLGVDAAAHAGEQGDRRGAQGEAGDRIEDDVVIGALEEPQAAVQPQQGAQAQGGQADHAHAHDGAAAEGDHERLVQAGAGRGRGADVGRGGHPHAEEACQARADGADHEGQAHHPAGGLHLGVGQRQDDAHQDHEDGQDLVLAAQKGHGALADVSADLLHLVGAGVGLVDRVGLEERVEQRQDSCDRSYEQVHDEGVVFHCLLPPEHAVWSEMWTWFAPHIVFDLDVNGFLPT